MTFLDICQEVRKTQEYSRNQVACLGTSCDVEKEEFVASQVNVSCLQELYDALVINKMVSAMNHAETLAQNLKVRYSVCSTHG